MIEVNNRTKTKINLKLIEEVADNFLKKYKIKDKEVSIVLVGDAVIKKLNKKYRGKDKVTDVLSFEGEGNFLGEILIDYSQIKRQATHYGNSTDEELIFILVHGLLHLLGHEDKTERGRKKMEKLGKEFIKNL